ncbi:MAG: hypothetical protein JGK17_27435 [Microcoleus sp. PH2017_10_PVI_O_A]|uniref:hypothetical protein n=1 Tax=unclassified Microcoleus TaxID=2642155 RepID=UPI001D8F5F57|nr:MULTISPECIES: hypothetical protein [unclassified Microcoleus]TAE74112.1 MAG: hypothetical protein EAZ83_30810 [Oscillatoriales cyanobacterium]MCC3409235.1 hypothetical protein [Microcoleus sp. PH2017_10_PVI_O_A]MCC3463470.1 hypothetical protein [Microcoleus sp. PH2017_11_PCY_U_A]MCC3481816.1 hypothetical protein [Microcoleus sp. PH2017_12_PCY_D_A]MCC3531573.1 hypothetical protein [Microcoleus sp. PH2017_21_RUC_O_A]
MDLWSQIWGATIVSVNRTASGVAGLAVAVAISRSILPDSIALESDRAVSTGKLAANLAVRKLICSAN